MTLPRSVTLVELPDAAELVATATPFVCANVVPPSDSATNEITAKYNRRPLFSFSANFFIQFNGLKFSNILPRISQGLALRATSHGTTQRFGLMGNKFRQGTWRCPKPTDQETAKKTGGARPDRRFSTVLLKTENSTRGATSIQAIGTATGTSHATGSTFPCAMATMRNRHHQEWFRHAATHGAACTLQPPP